MTWSPDRVVAIAKAVEGGYQLIGSGAVVADQRVLTALHVVKDHASVDEETRMTTPRLFARRDGSREFIPLGKALWRGDEHLDAAVFEWESARVVQPHPCSTLFAQDLAEGTPWSARGYPMLDPKTPRPSLARVGGALLRHFAGHDKELELPVGAVPHEFLGYQGLSGAVVLDNLDRVVGVVKAVTNPSVWDGKKLTAVPVSLLVQNDLFLAAIGAPAASQRLDDRLRTVIDAIKLRFASHDGLVREIASGVDEKRRWDGVHCTVEWLVRDVRAVALARAVRELLAAHPCGEEQRALLWLFWTAARYTIDWRDLLRANISQLGSLEQPQPLQLTLGCWSMTVAAVVLAGLDDVPVSFLAQGRADAGAREALCGANFLSLPATEFAPIFQRGTSRVTEAVVRNLANELAHPRFRKYAALSTEEQYALLCKHLEHTLRTQTYGHMPRQERSPRYLVVNAEDIAEYGANAFERIATAVHDVLPSLRVVLLEGEGFPNFDDENELDIHITAFARNQTS